MTEVKNGMCPHFYLLNQRNLGEIPNLFKIGIYLSKLPPY